jgi:hypothetical protein
MTAEFIGIAYIHENDYTRMEKVKLGRFAANPNGGWSNANNKAMKKLERKFPDAWMFDVEKVGWNNY